MAANCSLKSIYSRSAMQSKLMRSFPAEWVLTCWMNVQSLWRVRASWGRSVAGGKVTSNLTGSSSVLFIAIYIGPSCSFACMNKLFAGNQQLILGLFLQEGLQYMFLFQFGKKEPKKIDSDFAEKAKNALRLKICPHCLKNLSAKVVFGQGVQPGLTCINCELKAVGGTIQRLGANNLMTNDKFSSVLTNELIAYEAMKQDPPAENRLINESGQNLTKKIKETSDQIRMEYKNLKEKTKQKLDEINLEADQRNTVPVFEDVLRSQSEWRGALSLQQLRQMVKRSMVDGTGLHFVDTKAVEEGNNEAKEKLAIIRKQHRVKLKELNNLIDEIGSIKL